MDKEYIINANDPHTFVRCSEIKEFLFSYYPNNIGEKKLYTRLYDIEGYCKRKMIQSKVKTNIIMNFKFMKVSSRLKKKKKKLSNVIHKSSLFVNH